MARWSSDGSALYSEMEPTSVLNDVGVDDQTTYKVTSLEEGMIGTYVAGAVDLGASLTVDRVRFTMWSSSAGGYSALYSEDDITYDGIDSAFPGWNGWHTVVMDIAVPLTARYIKVFVFDQEPGNGPVEVRLSDLRVFNDLAEIPDADAGGGGGGDEPPADAPANFDGELDVCDFTVELSWEAVEGADGYTITRNGVIVGTSDEEMFTDEMPQSALRSEIEYEVYATNSAGAGPAATFTVTPPFAWVSCPTATFT